MEIELPGVISRAFRTILSYLYTDDYDVTDDAVIDAAQLADMYNLISLYEECAGYVRRNLGCWSLMIMDSQFCVQKLWNTCVTCLRTSMKTK